VNLLYYALNLPLLFYFNLENTFNMRKTLLFLACLFVFSLIEAQEVRTISGKSNNLLHPEMGAVEGRVIRVVSNGYADLVAEPAGHNRPNPRSISNYLFAQKELINDPRGLSDYAWVFGQFIDHDIVLVEDEKSEFMPIPVPAFDAHFDPMGAGNVMIPMTRSAYDLSTGTGPENPRQNNNKISAWIDASNVYGSDVYRANWLRTFQGGKLKVSAGNYLPYNTIDGTLEGVVDIDAPEMAMEHPFATKWFVAGDIRANENTLLTSIHTLFVREHNRLCEAIILADPTLSDEAIYQMARRKVGAFIQAVVYEEWLPTLGMEMPSYEGYSHAVNGNIMNVFSAAAFRYGHTTINSDIIRMDNNGEIISEGNTTLKAAFFNPLSLVTEGGIDPLLKGMATQVQQDFDCKMVDDLRNFLFGQPGAGGLDLAAINIQRGRDRGLPDYNTVRIDFDMPRITSFSELTTNPEVNQVFADLYKDVNDIDPWVGMLAEDHMPNALFGPTAMRIVEEQFQKLRDADRFYYENDDAFSEEEIAEIKSTTLAAIIRRNTEVTIHDEIFWAEPPNTLTSTTESLLVEEKLTSFPNPTKGHFVIELSSLSEGEGKIDIRNNIGQQIMQQKIQLKEGENQFQIDLPNNVTNGVYQVILQTNNEAISTKLLLLK